MYEWPDIKTLAQEVFKEWCACLPTGMTYAEWRDDLCKASERVGRTPAEVAKWLLTFVSHDLDKLLQGDWSNLSSEVAWVMLRGSWEGPINPPFEQEAMIFPDFRAPLDGTTRYLRKLLSPDGSLIRRAHRTSKAWVEGILRRKHVSYRFTELTLSLSFTLKFGEDDSGRWMHSIYTGSPLQRLQYGVLDILAQSADYVRQCPECSRLFLAERLNQGFCSVSCQARSATRRWRERHGLITGRPRGRPRKQSPEDAPQSKKGGSDGTQRRQGSRRRGKTQA